MIKFPNKYASVRLYIVIIYIRVLTQVCTFKIVDSIKTKRKKKKISLTSRTGIQCVCDMHDKMTKISFFLFPSRFID